MDITVGENGKRELLIEHRLKMWKEIYPDLEDMVEMSRQLTVEWLDRKLDSGEMVPFVAYEGREVLGSGCLLIKEDQVRVNSSCISYPYLLSMYTEPKHRNKGVGTAITERAIQWSRDNGYDRIGLHASPFGKGMYEKLGFRDTNEMRLWL